MRPSSSWTLEPELDRGVPWGRDLFTFVTSAAGHMMRTLQKPRKNRPSKRQVNHRRFLHNMIQRKFADIEAANHQLASALFSTEKTLMSDQSSHTAQPDSTSGEGIPHDPARSTSCNTLSEGSKDARSVLISHETDVRRTKATDSDFSKRQMDKPTNPTQRNSRSKGIHQQTQVKSIQNLTEYIFINSQEQTPDFTLTKELFDEDYFSHEEELQATNNSEKTRCCCSESALDEFDTRNWTEFCSTSPHGLKPQAFAPVMETSSSVLPPSWSPELSPLSLDSCDFGIQMATDISTCSQLFSHMADPIEKQHVDILDLLEPDVNDRSFGCCMDAQDCVETIWARQDEADTLTGKENIDDVTFLDQSVSLMELMINTCTNSSSELDQLDSGRGEKGYGIEHRFFTHQGTTEGEFLTSQEDTSHCVSSSMDGKVSMRQCLSLQGVSLTPAQRPTNLNYPGYIQDPILLQNSCPQQVGSLVLSDVSHQHCTPFEGVAQSFPAPSWYPQPQPILTPPLEEDWLFANIMEDGELFGW